MGLTRREALVAGATALAWPSAAGACVRVAPFAMVGVSWRAPRRVSIELRTRLGDGPWSPWVLASAGGHSGDGQSGLYGEPVWVARADQVQLRGTAGVTGARVHTVPVAATAAPAGEARAARAAGPAGEARSAAPAGEARAALALAAPVLPAGPGQPPIIARAAWAGDGLPPRAGPFYGAIKLAFVHHTDNPNGYSAGQVPALLRAMYHYHRDVRGYYDIAYNFVIDAFGRIWEARAGGIDEPVLGAHAGGFNGVSTGVAVLGTFMDVVPPRAAQVALERLLAWKLSLHGVPTLGHVRVEVNPADAFYTPFAPGQRVLLPRVAGHRDGDLTDCPGNAFYHRLPVLRPRIASLAGPLTTLSVAPVDVVVAPGATVTLSGRLVSDGAGVAGAPIAVQAVAGRRTLARVTTDADGRWSAAVIAPRNLLLRALHAVAPAATSPVVEIDVRPVIALTLVSTYPLTITGTVSPSKSSVIVDVYRNLGGRRRVASLRVRARGGRFSVRPKVGVGSYTVIARTIADARTIAAASPPLAVIR